jgi:Domain of unknown function (DUF6265)
MRISPLRNFVRRAAVVCSVFVAATSAYAQAQTPAPAGASVPAGATARPAPVVAAGKNTVDAYGWLVGCWQAKAARDGSTINEIWLSPRGGSLMGIGQTYLDGKTPGWEAMRMYNEGEAVKLWLRPAQRNELTLNLEEAGDAYVGFTFKEGETTTKLRYERKSATEMIATFRLEQGENRRGADFAFTKVECADFFAPLAK